MERKKEVASIAPNTISDVALELLSDHSFTKPMIETPRNGRAKSAEIRGTHLDRIAGGAFSSTDDEGGKYGDPGSGCIGA
jgi:hypothetical protein